MRTLLLAAVAVLALVGLPARSAGACPAPSIPVYPGGQAAGGDGTSLPVLAGNQFIATTAPLVDVQSFYYTRLPNEGWVSVAQLPGQYIEQFSSAGGPTIPGSGPQGVLEFSRNDDHEHVRVVGQAGGYSLYVDCRD